MAIPALIWVVGRGRPEYFSFLVFIVTLICLLEYYAMAFPGQWRQRVIGVVAGLFADPGLPNGGAWFSGMIVLLFTIYLFFSGKREERFHHLVWTLLGTLYIGYLIPHAALLYRLSDGKEWVFFVLLVIMVGDTAGYFVGSLLGRRKLFPEVSPGKTVEGAVGSLAASLLAGAIGGRLFLPVNPWLEILGISLVLSLLGQVGDLFESWIKRAFAVKDSGAILPGHGGLLDRMDSLIFPFVFMTYYLRALHL